MMDTKTLGKLEKLNFYTYMAKTIIENYDKVECEISTEKDHNVITDVDGNKYYVCEKGIRPAYSKKFEDMYPEDSWMTDCEFAMFFEGDSFGLDDSYSGQIGITKSKPNLP